MITRTIEPSVPPDGDRRVLPEPDTQRTRKAAISWLATTVILVGVGLTLLLIVAIMRFGSAASALAYLRGDSLIPDTYSKSFGSVGKGERPAVSFALRNYTKRPIKVLGTNSSCTCLVTSSLPIVVAPNDETILSVSARAKSNSGQFSERLRVLTDSAETNLVLRVQGVFQ